MCVVGVVEENDVQEQDGARTSRRKRTHPQPSEEWRQRHAALRRRMEELEKEVEQGEEEEDEDEGEIAVISGKCQ